MPGGGCADRGHFRTFLWRPRPRVDGIAPISSAIMGWKVCTRRSGSQQAQDCCRAWLKTVTKAERELTRAGVVVEDKMFSDLSLSTGLFAAGCAETIFHVGFHAPRAPGW